MPDSPKPEVESDFVCGCDEWFRTACVGEPFYGEHEGRRYCVLHLPVCDKKTVFEEALNRKLAKADYDFCGVWFPDDVKFYRFDFTRAVDFRCATFSSGAVFSFSTFRANVNFHSATFSQAAAFSFTTFSATATFSNVTFGGVASFGDASFSAEADFHEAIFNEDAYFIDGTTFGAKANFGRTSFKAPTYFSNATFRARTDFEYATFDADVFFAAVTFNSADFIAAAFDKEANFTTCKFEAEAVFKEATFRGDANFDDSIFMAGADFLKSTFTADANFPKSTFIAKANFSHATFDEKANFGLSNFGAGADFGWTTFGAETHFTLATFSAGAYFVNAIFTAIARFSGATFGGDVNFREAIFNGNAEFIDCTLTGKADFGNVTFREYVKFAGKLDDRPVFSETSALDLQFATFEKPDRCSFHTLTLRSHWFVNVDARKFEFINVKWQVNTSQEIKDLSVPAERMIWYSGEFGLGASAHQLLAIAFRHLAVNAEDNHRYEEASRFRYMAMDTRRRETWRGFTPWRVSWWYWLASGYGERVPQAFLVLLGIWFVAALFYAEVGFARWEPKLASESDVAAAKRDNVGAPLPFRRALTHSLAVMTLQKPEPRPATIAAQTVVLFETILGPVQAALLALAIRRKFMR